MDGKHTAVAPAINRRCHVPLALNSDRARNRDIFQINWGRQANQVTAIINHSALNSWMHSCRHITSKGMNVGNIQKLQEQKRRQTHDHDHANNNKIF
ncbi:MAG TPA: hypothetical protein PLD25_03250 [Chloroflexota bacterium]|nr:hypothetical protein [Chloroflexota bacterium]